MTVSLVLLVYLMRLKFRGKVHSLVHFRGFNVIKSVAPSSLGESVHGSILDAYFLIFSRALSQTGVNLI